MPAAGERPVEGQPEPPVTDGAGFVAVLSVEPDPDAAEPSAGQLAGRPTAAGDSKVLAQWELPASKSAVDESGATESESLEQSWLVYCRPERRHASELAGAAAESEFAEHRELPRWPGFVEAAEHLVRA